MRYIYAALLRLYPAEHRQMFAAEMLDTFDQAATDWRARGVLAFACFAGWELTGLLHGLLSEWMARETDLYLCRRARLQEEGDLPTDLAGMKRHLDTLVRNMEFAISHHDFPKARFYSEKERVVRQQLQRLVSV